MSMLYPDEHMNSKYLSPLRILIGVGRRANAFTRKRAKEKRRANAKAWISHFATPPLNVNVGCGKEPFKGWINLDLDPESRADILWDVTDGLAFASDSCAFIYCEHFLEHVPVEDGVRFLVECRRSLQKGGVLRIGMPSAQEIVRHYHENDWAHQPWLEKYGYTWIKTRAEYINVCFREWGHQWLYDAEELQRRLREAGFTQTENVAWGESRHAELRNRETRFETLLICEATK
jgi:predicted SAM-dependent methyltransferase